MNQNRICILHRKNSIERQLFRLFGIRESADCAVRLHALVAHISLFRSLSSSPFAPAANHSHSLTWSLLVFLFHSKIVPWLRVLFVVRIKCHWTTHHNTNKTIQIEKSKSKSFNLSSTVATGKLFVETEIRWIRSLEPFSGELCVKLMSRPHFIWQ